MIREPIYQALFALLAAAPGLVSAQRGLKHWDDVSSGQQPALFMVEEGETGVTTTGLPVKWTGHVGVYVYARAETLGGAGPLLNPILDYIEAQFAPNGNNNYANLGSLVQHIRIEGEIMKDGGALGEQAVAIIPVRFLTA